MTCLSGSHSFQLLICVLSGDQFTIFILFKRPARPRPFLMIDSAEVDEYRRQKANRDFAESDHGSFGDRSGNSQRHQASHVTAIGETTVSVSRSRARKSGLHVRMYPGLAVIRVSASVQLLARMHAFAARPGIVRRARTRPSARACQEPGEETDQFPHPVSPGHRPGGRRR